MGHFEDGAGDRHGHLVGEHVQRAGGLGRGMYQDAAAGHVDAVADAAPGQAQLGAPVHLDLGAIVQGKKGAGVTGRANALAAVDPGARGEGFEPAIDQLIELPVHRGDPRQLRLVQRGQLRQGQHQGHRHGTDGGRQGQPAVAGAAGARGCGFGMLGATPGRVQRPAQRHRLARLLLEQGVLGRRELARQVGRDGGDVVVDGVPAGAGGRCLVLGYHTLRAALGGEGRAHAFGGAGDGLLVGGIGPDGVDGQVKAVVVDLVSL